MKSQERSAITANLSEICDILAPSVDQLMTWLAQHSVISSSDIEKVRAVTPISKQRVINLFELLQRKDNSWDKLMNFLTDNGYTSLANQLTTDTSSRNQFAVANTGSKVVPCPSETNELNETMIRWDWIEKKLKNHHENKFPRRIFGIRQKYFQQKQKLPETRQEAVAEVNSESHWSRLQIIKRTAQLAFWACAFDPIRTCFKEKEILKHVTSDDIEQMTLYGFLEVHGKMIAFSSYDQQEFFAALHCFQLVTDEYGSEAKAQLCKICISGGQVGRFFFGICSKFAQSKNMLKWLRPSFGDIKHLLIPSADFFLQCISSALKDCSTNESRAFGESLFNSQNDPIDLVTAFDRKDAKCKREYYEELSLNESFSDGLKLQICEKSDETQKSIKDWFIKINHSEASLARILAVPITIKLDQIGGLVWLLDVKRYDVYGQISGLPNTRVLIICPPDECNCRVDFTVVERSPNSSLILSRVSIFYYYKGRHVFQTKLPDNLDISITLEHPSEKSSYLKRFNIGIKQTSIGQADLISYLIQFFNNTKKPTKWRYCV